MSNSPELNHKGSVFLIDHEPSSVAAVADALTDHGLKVHPIGEGQLGLELVKQIQPDVVLMNHRLPDIDTYEACARLKADRLTEPIPIILMHPVSEAFDKVKALRSGVADYVSKPIVPEEVVARVNTHLSLRKLSANVDSAVRERTAELLVTNAKLEAEISVRKRAELDLRKSEAELRRSEGYLAEAQALTHTGSWAWDVRRREYIYWSKELFRVFGLDPEVDRPSSDTARDRMHPGDWARVAETRERALREKTGYKVDFRVALPDGSTRYAEGVGHPVANPEGEITEFIGTIVDVTEQYETRSALQKALSEIQELKDRLYRENLALRDDIDRTAMFDEILGSSEAIQRVLALVARVAPTNSTVLITGETGTGKELIARAIHKYSSRSEGPFVRVNSAAIPSSLIASELFGHEKGAFTGAASRRIGRFELAHKGTLFLDEIGDLPLETQVSLLRVLQEKEFERIGGSEPIFVDVRLLAATNRDLKAAMAAGLFRSDLYYRLNVFPIRVPPLRERREDILLLAAYFMERYARRAGKIIKGISPQTEELFLAYPWPGNIRELQNIVERAVILHDGPTVSIDRSWLQQESSADAGSSSTLAKTLLQREKEMIEAALAESKGRISGPGGAAAKLGIPRSTLETKIRSLGIQKHRFK